MELSIEECLDERNRDFYNTEIKPFLNLKILQSKEMDLVWTASYHDNNPDVFIYAGINYPHIESFTHEMLHLYLFKNGFSSGAFSHYNFFHQITKNLLYPIETLEGISNAIAHFKMVGIFTNDLKMDIAQFFSRIESFTTSADLENLVKSKLNSTLQSEFFTNFIRHFFNTRYHFMDKYRELYFELNHKLKIIEPVLYEILIQNCVIWEKDILDYDNTTFFSGLFADLEIYLEKTNI